MRESDRELLLNFPGSPHSRDFHASSRRHGSNGSVNSRRKLKANTPWRFFPLIILPSMSPSIRLLFQQSRNSTSLLASLTVLLLFLFAYFFKTSPVALLLALHPSPFPLSPSLCFLLLCQPQFFIAANAFLARYIDLANPRNEGGGGSTEGKGREEGGEGLKMEDFIRGEGTEETEHEGNGETKRLKGNRTSKRSTKRKKARKGERSLCVCVC